MSATDARRYGRGLAGILHRLEHSATTPADAGELRAELEAMRCVLEQERNDRARRIRAGLGLARGTLENLIQHNARPVKGGVFVLIEGGRSDRPPSLR